MHDRPQGDKPYLFVSYGSRDRDAVRAIVDVLAERGLDTWFDVEDIAVGASYGSEIVDGVKNAAALLLMCSKASLASRNVMQEIQLAWQHERPILPLVLEPITFPDDVAYWLANSQWLEVMQRPTEQWLPPLLNALHRAGLPVDRELTVSPSEVMGSPFEMPANNLPDRLQAIIGRDREIKQVQSLLANGRLITLTGPGGAGKTRLALETAKQSASDFPDGVWFVDASSRQNGEGLLQAIADVMEVQQQAGQSLSESVSSTVADSRVLLLIDNLEQIADAGEVVESLLAAAPNLSALATSRGPLKAASEWVYSVPLLASPDLHGDLSPSILGRNASVALFIARAKEAKADFQLNDGNAAAVAEICIRLEGLPLAIELAAARVRLLPPAALLQRLESRLNVLTRGSSLSGRQQTLRSTIAWSYDLLDAPEQATFRRLGVFEGGASLAACEAVSAAVTADDVDSIAVLDAVETLADQHLVRIEDDATGEPRIRMLESLREFAVEMLDDSQELTVTQQALVAYFASVADELSTELIGAGQLAALTRLDAENANVRAAIRLAPAETQVAMGAALWRYWWMRGRTTEGLQLLQPAKSAVAASVSGSARLMIGLGVFHESTGDLDAAESAYEQGLALAIEAGDRVDEARANSSLALVAVSRSNYDEAQQRLEIALQQSRDAKDDRNIAVTLLYLVDVAIYKAEHDRAAELADEAVQAWRTIRDPQGIGHALQYAAIAYLLSGDYKSAAASASEASSIAESTGDLTGWGNALLNLGSALDMSGQFEDAETALNRALELFEEASDPVGVAHAHHVLGHIYRRWDRPHESSQHSLLGLNGAVAADDQSTALLCLEVIAGLAIDQGEALQAASILGFCSYAREEIGAPVPATRTSELDSDIESARGIMATSAYESAFEAGMAFSMDDVRKYAEAASF